MKISKLLGSVMAVLALTTVSFAQSVSVGITGGGNYSKLLGIDSAKFKTGASAGLSVLFQSPGKISTSVDVIYTQRGTTYERNFKDTAKQQTEKYQYDMSFNYIEIPVLVRYNFLPDSSSFKAMVFAGPSLNVRYNAKNSLKYTKVISYGDSSVTVNHEGKQDLAYIYTPLDYGIVGGFGLSYEINDKLSAGFDFRASYGLLDIREYLSKSSKAVRNNNYSVMVAVRYKLQ
ncbi:MAG: PorT family protein [Bacteroidia bacterium]|nr:PorT family protein [Bacteroidia bacterium]MCZ2247988.1 PorT family protein [Bacteroidia bacterium]